MVNLEFNKMEQKERKHSFWSICKSLLLNADVIIGFVVILWRLNISDKDFLKRKCVCSDELCGNKNHMRKTPTKNERNDSAFKMTEHAT